jgi:hypothetical protein
VHHCHQQRRGHILAGRIAHQKDEPVFVERDEINGSDAERIGPRKNVLVTVCARRLALEQIAALNDAKEYNRKSRSAGAGVSNPRASRPQEWYFRGASQVCAVVHNLM